MNFRNIEKILPKYRGEEFFVLSGAMTHQDSMVTYGFIREQKPKSVLEIGPGRGRSTSVIYNALLKNGIECEYLIAEKDRTFKRNISRYVKYLEKENGSRDLVKTTIVNNIIKSDEWENREFDLIFLDAAHDFVFGRWWMVNLVPRLRPNGLIHVHDVSFNIYLRGWQDVLDTIPDLEFITSSEYLKREYSYLSDSLYQIPKTVITSEAKELYFWTQVNRDNITFMSTAIGPYSTLSNEHTINSSMWIQVFDPGKIKLPWILES